MLTVTATVAGRTRVPIHGRSTQRMLRSTDVRFGWRLGGMRRQSKRMARLLACGSGPPRNLLCDWEESRTNARFVGTNMSRAASRTYRLSRPSTRGWSCPFPPC